MELEREALAQLKKKISPAWYDLHFDDAVSSTLYSLGYDTIQKLKVDNLKRHRRNLKLEISRLGEESIQRGQSDMNSNYILTHAKSLNICAKDA